MKNEINFIFCDYVAVSKGHLKCFVWKDYTVEVLVKMVFSLDTLFCKGACVFCIQLEEVILMHALLSAVDCDHCCLLLTVFCIIAILEATLGSLSLSTSVLCSWGSQIGGNVWLRSSGDFCVRLVTFLIVLHMVWWLLGTTLVKGYMCPSCSKAKMMVHFS